MRVIEYSVMINKPASEVWRKLTEVEKWTSWDQSIDTISFSDSFKEGAKGIFRPKGAPSDMEFRLENVTDNKRFDVISDLPLWTKVIFEHHLDPVEADKTKLTHTVEIVGSVSYVFNLIIGGGMKTALAPSMEALKTELEKVPAVSSIVRGGSGQRAMKMRRTE